MQIQFAILWTILLMTENEFTVSGYEKNAITNINCVQKEDQGYLLSVTKMNWYEAKNFCENNGMHLTSIEDNAESVFVSNQMAKLNNLENFWIGITDAATPGEFRHYLTNASLNFTNWEKGYSKKDKSNVACVSVSAMKTVWLPQSCTDFKNSFVCKSKERKCFEKEKGWAPWNSWSKCSLTCGSDGQIHRTRNCRNQLNSKSKYHFCKGKSYDRKPCRVPACSEKSMNKKSTLKEVMPYAIGSLFAIVCAAVVGSIYLYMKRRTKHTSANSEHSTESSDSDI